MIFKDSDAEDDQILMKRDTFRGGSVKLASQGERDVELTYNLLQTEEKVPWTFPFCVENREPLVAYKIIQL